jgi:NADH-quinone oxidoreductase subunit F
MDEGSVDLTVVDRVVAEVGRSPDATIPILQALQAEYRWLPEAALRRVCELTEITPANLVGVATFYDHFRFRPMGRHVLRVCHGTACHVKGAVPLQNAIEERLGIPAGEDTDPEGRTTVQKVACLGCCTLAPVVQSEHRTFGHLTPAGVPELLEAVERAAAEAEAARGEPGTVAVNGHGEILDPLDLDQAIELGAFGARARGFDRWSAPACAAAAAAASRRRGSGGSPAAPTATAST